MCYVIDWLCVWLLYVNNTLIFGYYIYEWRTVIGTDWVSTDFWLLICDICWFIYFIHKHLLFYYVQSVMVCVKLNWIIEWLCFVNLYTLRGSLSIIKIQFIGVTKS